MTSIEAILLCPATLCVSNILACPVGAVFGSCQLCLTNCLLDWSGIVCRGGGRFRGAVMGVNERAPVTRIPEDNIMQPKRSHPAPALAAPCAAALCCSCVGSVMLCLGSAMLSCFCMLCCVGVVMCGRCGAVLCLPSV